MTVTIDVVGNARAWASRLSRLGIARPSRGVGSRRDVHRFDGERPYITRGGASIGDVKASWSLAELSISSTHAVLRSRPSGLFPPVRIERDAVHAIGIRPGELGVGITFGDAYPDVVFWPSDARAILTELHDRGWPARA